VAIVIAGVFVAGVFVAGMFVAGVFMGGGLRLWRGASDIPY
jgi:hypothetical protein